jgi:addiction module HigA family antidote
MLRNGMRPIHPGEILLEDFLKPINMSANALSKELHVPATRVNDIVRGRRGVTPDTALRLARFFGGDAQSWLNLQQAYDLKLAEKAFMKKITEEIVPLLEPGSGANDARFNLAG